MRIEHPLLGLRDCAEFTVLGDAALLNRPTDPDDPAALQAFHDHVYLRDNPAGVHRELWYHEHGDHSWLVVTRDTVTHAIKRVELARDIALAQQRRNAP